MRSAVDLGLRVHVGHRVEGEGDVAERRQRALAVGRELGHGVLAVLARPGRVDALVLLLTLGHNVLHNRSSAYADSLPEAARPGATARYPGRLCPRPLWRTGCARSPTAHSQSCSARGATCPRPRP